jgi:hypothetical protein
MLEHLTQRSEMLLLFLVVIAAIGDFLITKIRNWRSGAFWFWLSSPLLLTLIHYFGSQDVTYISHDAQFIFLIVLLSVALPMSLMALIYRAILSAMSIKDHFRNNNSGAES